MNLFISRNGQQLGPYSLEQVQTQVTSGTILPTDLAWHEGLAGWVPLAQIAGFSSPASPPAFTAGPPPYRPARPILATVISIFYFVTVPFGLLSLFAVHALANTDLPGMEGTRSYYQAFNGIDHALSATVLLANLAGALFLFWMRRPALYCFIVGFCVNLAYQVRLVFFKDFTISLPGKNNPFAGLMQQSVQSGVYMGFIIGMGISGGLVYYAWYLTKRGQLR